MLRTALVTLAFVAGASGPAVAGCGASPVAAEPTGDSAVADVHGTGDVQREAGMQAASDSGPGVCGCAHAPICGESCLGPCGCCPCLPGELLTVGSRPYQCRADTVCYEAAPCDPANGAHCDGADAATADGTSDDAGFACGTQTCTAAQLCAYSYGGGGPANCSPTNDAGGCPIGFTYAPSCPNLANRPGCNAPLPPPAPVGCIDIPTSCGVAPTCACFPVTACPAGTGSCQGVTARSLLCAAE